MVLNVLLGSASVRSAFFNLLDLFLRLIAFVLPLVSSLIIFSILRSHQLSSCIVEFDLALNLDPDVCM